MGNYRRFTTGWPWAGVYVIAAADPAITGFKIGESMQEVQARHTQIQACSPIALDIVGTIGCPDEISTDYNCSAYTATKDYIRETEMLVWFLAEHDGHQRSHYEWFEGHVTPADITRWGGIVNSASWRAGNYDTARERVLAWKAARKRHEGGMPGLVKQYSAIDAALGV